MQRPYMSPGAKTYFCPMRSSVLLFSLVATSTFGQWDVPVRLVLDAPDGGQRQVVGVAPPASPDAAVSLEAARDLRSSFAQVTGTDVLIGSLSPAIGAYVQGMVVTVIPQNANAQAAQLDLNGTGPVPIVRQDGSPLEAGDLNAGMPVRLAYDGSAFRVLNSIRLKCPAGFTAGSNEFCIEDSARTATSYWTANVRCGNANARLCSVAEWMTACARIPGFFGTVPEAEWMDHAGNNVTSAKLIGHGLEGIDISSFGAGCTYGNWDVPGNSHPHRCCISR